MNNDFKLLFICLFIYFLLFYSIYFFEESYALNNWLSPESISKLSRCKLAVIYLFIYFYLTYVIARILFEVK